MQKKRLSFSFQLDWKSHYSLSEGILGVLFWCKSRDNVPFNDICMTCIYTYKHDKNLINTYIHLCCTHVHIGMHIHTYLYIYIYIYIERERERKKEKGLHTYIYVWWGWDIHTCVYFCVGKYLSTMIKEI